ncbi:GTPase family protein, partial [Brachybacterium hainanense]
MSRRRAAPALPELAAALGRAAESMDQIAPASALAHARDVLARGRRRRTLSAEHTVVGVFGATGSGKSSLVNALVGQQITRAAVRRPTTAAPVAAIVGEDGAEELLDWLEVGDRHVLVGESSLAGEAEGGGIILLDLPDLDSVERGNRAVAERMTGLVDVIVWVTDPQKYADAVLHRDFVAPFAGHEAVTLAVLNQVDLIRPGERAGVLASFAAILRRDGLADVEVLGVSAQTGEGIEELRSRLRRIARARDAATLRGRADVQQAARRLREAADPAGLPARVLPADAAAVDAAV